jgi:hypothetical protein
MCDIQWVPYYHEEKKMMGTFWKIECLCLHAFNVFKCFVGFYAL